MIRLRYCFLLLLVLAAPGAADTWRVAPDGSGDFLTIQEAIDFAAAGDEIRIAPATYPERLDTRGKSIALVGESGALRTTVDGGAGGAVLEVPYSPGGGPTVRGLTFTNGIGKPVQTPDRQGRYGGAVWIEVSFGLFESCVFRGNRADAGGAVYVTSGGPRFDRCVFSGNLAGEGGAIALDHDQGTRFEDCRITDNEAVQGGGLTGFRARPNLVGTTIARNRSVYGGAVHLIDAGSGPARIERCLLVENEAGEGGGLWAVDAILTLEETTVARNRIYPGGASVELIDVILTARRSILETNDGPLFACDGGSQELDCLVLWSPDGSGLGCGGGDRVWIADPLFCAPEESDYALRPDSPCLPGQGPPGCARIGARDVGCDLPVAVRQVRWGEIRLGFR